MITVIKPATIGDYLAFYKAPMSGWVIFANGERVGMAGIALNETDQKFWGYFNIKDKVSSEVGADLIRQIRGGLKAMTEPVYVLCQECDFPQAPRLLKALGFKPTGEIKEGQEVWKCQA